MKCISYLGLITGIILGDIILYVLYGDSIILEIIYKTINTIYVVS